MNLRCTTHFHACDCREEKFKQIEKENEELRALIKKENHYKFYNCDCPPGMSCDCEWSLDKEGGK